MLETGFSSTGTFQAEERKPMGRLVSDLEATALAARKKQPSASPRKWVSRPMGARVNLEDKDALHSALDAGSH